MARITVCGDATVITSGLKLDDIKMVNQFNPSVLTLIEDESPVFKIGVTDCEEVCGSVSNVGAIFNNKTHDNLGYATLTLYTVYKGTAGEIKDEILNKLTPALAKLNKLELQVEKALEDIRVQKTALESSITII